MDVTMSEYLLAEAEAAEAAVYEVHPEIQHLATPEKIGASLEIAREKGLPYYWREKPDREGNHVFYAKGERKSVLITYRHNRANIASGKLAASSRRYRENNLEACREKNRRWKEKNPEALFVVDVLHGARREADLADQPRRPEAEERYLASVAKVTYALKRALGGHAPVIHHAVREIDEGGGHVPGNLCILPAGLHTAWHHAADRTGSHVSVCLLQAVLRGEVVPCPTLAGVFIERELLDKLALVAIQEAPDLLLSPMIAEAAARLRPEPSNDNQPVPEASVA